MKACVPLIVDLAVATEYWPLIFCRFAALTRSFVAENQLISLDDEASVIVAKELTFAAVGIICSLKTYLSSDPACTPLALRFGSQWFPQSH